MRLGESLNDETSHDVGALPPRLAGYDVSELVAIGRYAAVWRARTAVGDRSVALKRPHATREAAARVVHEAAILRAARHDHVVAFLGLEREPWRQPAPGLPCQCPVLVTEYAEGGTLAELLANRIRLSPAEVVTLGVPIARALDLLRRRGIRHGDLRPANIAFTADGKPLLIDFGHARWCDAPQRRGRRGERRPGVAGPDPDDVRAFLDLLRLALIGAPPPEPSPPLGVLAGDIPEPLSRLLELAAATDPTTLGLETFARELLAACTPAPITLVSRTAASRSVSPTPEEAGEAASAGASVAPSPGRRSHWAVKLAGAHRRRRSSPVRLSSTRTGVVVGAIAVLAVAALAALALVRTGHATARPAQLEPADAVAATPQESGHDPARGSPEGPSVSAPSDGIPARQPADARGTPDWPGVVAELYARRAHALINRDPALLATVYTPTSPLAAADGETVAGLRAVGARVEGFAPRVLSVDVIQADRTTAVLRVTDQLPPYGVATSGGRQANPGRGPVTRLITLRYVDGEWLIDAIDLAAPVNGPTGSS
ncbi:serine/threonine protein kinase [Acidothermus cellulolyticus 11B]|uniref:Serine/threonine protein kinase n=1 Tax=Acidothermus cellulolyticus (strain ATCC 43068 / DSM 8971 / 11B) TaxID=351607 RepID=A0LTE4_ACIC1|nr:protein kinase [Acidothermus cellulolyticus]ABK52704.1 serine/threonine protein kinase [Acidothermus cellulolyticus 11B]